MAVYVQVSAVYTGIKAPASQSRHQETRVRSTLSFSKKYISVTRILWRAVNHGVTGLKQGESSGGSTHTAHEYGSEPLNKKLHLKARSFI